MGVGNYMKETARLGGMSKSEVGRIILTMKKCDYHVIKGTKLIHTIDLKVLPLHARCFLAIAVWWGLVVSWWK